MTALLHRLNEAVGMVYLFLGIEQRFLVAAAHGLLAVAVGVDHLRERVADLQRGDVSIVDGECHPSVIIGIDDEVGGHLLHVSALGLTHRRPWFRIELVQFALKGLALEIGELQLLIDFIPSFVGEFFEIIGDHLPHQSPHIPLWLSIDL